ncbi:hypothetical protein QMK33_22560 [Hymenobacter sp. H14-R3]|nr:hypothetical protein [Hymenobacter sp. H14-R3]MDJ0367934.1 hypothetical protein [Hymenobacter sp. H14-R3]
MHDCSSTIRVVSYFRRKALGCRTGTTPADRDRRPEPEAYKE